MDALSDLPNLTYLTLGFIDDRTIDMSCLARLTGLRSLTLQVIQPQYSPSQLIISVSIISKRVISSSYSFLSHFSLHSFTSSMWSCLWLFISFLLYSSLISHHHWYHAGTPSPPSLIILLSLALWHGSHSSLSSLFSSSSPYLQLYQCHFTRPLLCTLPFTIAGGTRGGDEKGNGSIPTTILILLQFLITHCPSITDEVMYTLVTTQETIREISIERCIGITR